MFSTYSAGLGVVVHLASFCDILKLPPNEFPLTFQIEFCSKVPASGGDLGAVYLKVFDGAIKSSY